MQGGGYLSHLVEECKHLVHGQVEFRRYRVHVTMLQTGGKKDSYLEVAQTHAWKGRKRQVMRGKTSSTRGKLLSSGNRRGTEARRDDCL